MSKQKFPHKILWLASYPKSGNTWFRAFLSALMNEGKVDINKMDTDGIFSFRQSFDLVTDIDSRDLYDEEAKLIIADVQRFIASENDFLTITKIHDAFGTDPEGKNLVPEDVTHCALYFIRNPLDIAGSLAHHNQSSIEEAVAMLCNSNAVLGHQKNNLNKINQFSQYLSDWSSHVKSWTLKPTFPVLVTRYEDMLTDPFVTFSKAVEFCGLVYSPSDIRKAIASTSFDLLKQQETEKGFRERKGSGQFFRKGSMGNWEEELSPDQIKRIKEMHREVMDQYGY